MDVEQRWRRPSTAASLTKAGSLIRRNADQRRPATVPNLIRDEEAVGSSLAR